MADNGIIKPVKDQAWVTEDGEPVINLIHGVEIRYAKTQADARGTVCEILNPEWGVHPGPIVYVYQFTIRPGMVKGWHVHHLHDDRIFVSSGTVKVVLYDDRPDSPTYGVVNEIYRHEHRRSIMVIPRFVWHAHENVGDKEALMVSMPSRPYQHDDPDVFRLPINNEYIPYKFDKPLGW